MNKRKVVIVDDDEDLLRILVYAFESKGFEVDGLSTGKAAMDYLSNEKNMKGVVLLVLDRILPDMEGLDILKSFLKKYGKKTPVLVLSMLGSDKDVLEGLKVGAAEYIEKPFNQDILIEKALALIERG